MAEYKADLRDIRFVLFDQLKVQETLGKAPFDDFDRDTVEMMVDEAYKFARDVLAPLNETGDRVGVKFDAGKVTMVPGTKEAYATFADNGWMGLTNHPDYGGQGAPWSLSAATSELFEGACLAFNLTRLLTTGCANLIDSFGTDALKNRFIPNMTSGQWTGTMCLTEAGAGSDVGASRTTAVPEGDHFLIEGEKIFITSGDHDLAENVVHAVLARTPGAPAGTKGLSLFVVPKHRVNADGSLGEYNNVQCLRIEEKMGIHASPTCVMGFGQSGQTIGYLLGEELAGMREMFQMMNEARLSVGIEGAAIANAAYQAALGYAKERIQGRDLTRRKQGAVAIVEHPDVRMMLLYSKACAEGIRALGYFTASCIDRAAVAEAAGDEDVRAYYHGLLEVLTPIVKAYGSDMGFKVADRAVQIHGGYGYTQEFPAEQYLRDVRISAIYEGANGIQALDLVGRKLGQNGGRDARNFIGELQKIAKTVQGPGLEGVAKHIAAAQGAMMKAAMGFAGMRKDNPLGPVINASAFLELAGDTVVGTLLGQQAALALGKLAKLAGNRGVDPTDPKAVHALAEDDDEACFLWGKLAAARFFAERILALAPAKAEVMLNKELSAMEVVF